MNCVLSKNALGILFHPSLVSSDIVEVSSQAYLPDRFFRSIPLGHCKTPSFVWWTEYYFLWGDSMPQSPGMHQVRTWNKLIRNILVSKTQWKWMTLWRTPFSEKPWKYLWWPSFEFTYQILRWLSWMPRSSPEITKMIAITPKVWWFVSQIKHWFRFEGLSDSDTNADFKM